jgi:hypothetical protein
LFACNSAKEQETMASTLTPDLERLRYPIGRFDPKAELPAAARGSAIESIAGTPARFRKAIAGLTETQLDTPYREGGWTIRQLIHHVPDSHLNAYVRFKLALTEEVPTIKPYDEAAWATLADSRSTPIETSLALLESIHTRWDIIMRSMSDSDFQRRFNHPEWGNLDLTWMVRMYEWHGRHHAAHITSLRQRLGW